MGYNGYTTKKKASNERYLAKLDSFMVRMQPEERKELQQAVSAAGMSRNAFILQAIKEKIEREGK